MRILVAGGSGAVGTHLIPMLTARGHTVAGTTRAAAKGEQLRAAGATPLVVDALDAGSVMKAVGDFAPEVVIHQLTALGGPMNLRKFDDYFAATNTLRTIGTDNLLTAAVAAKVRRFVAQSFGGWTSRRIGGPVKTEDDPMEENPPRNAVRTLAGLRYVETAVTGSRDIEGVALRYGGFYGPGNGIGKDGEVLEMIRKRQLPIVGGGTGVWSFLHIEDAASAAVAAAEGGPQGIYNIADDEPAPVHVWLPYLAEVIGAKAPFRLPTWLAKPLLGEQGVSMMTDIRGISNAKAKAELGWKPRYGSWRQGFRDGLG
jgi:nucleoside-diphosphate-sugar epimerase